MPKADKIKKKPESGWNTPKPGGWETYKDLSNIMANKINDIASD